MPRYYMLRRVLQLADEREARLIALDVVCSVKASDAFHVLVEVTRVSGEDNPPAGGPDPDDLHSRCVPADQMNLDARPETRGAVVQHRALRVRGLHDIGYIGCLEGAACRLAPSAGGELELPFLQVEPGA